ncbi:MAG: OB-fold domain-containing protein, partial [Planctomycetota bacterium]
MYDYVRGPVTARADGAVVVEAAGLGYRLAVSASTLRRVPASGEATLYTHL